MVVTELVTQAPMGWLKAKASYSSERDGWARGVSVDTKSRRQATTKQ